MATAMELVKECRICALTFVNPKLLPCHHTFCEACVKKMAKGSNRLVCPTCRRKCQVRDIVTDFRLDEFLQALEEQEENVICLQTKVTDTKIETCDVCGANQVSLYCRDCDVWICAPCRWKHCSTYTMGNCQIEDLTTMRKEIEECLGNETRAIKSKLGEYDSVLASFQCESERTEDILTNTVQVSKNLRESLHKEVDKRMDELDSVVSTYSEAHRTQLKQAKETCAQKYDKFRANYSDIEQQLDEQSLPTKEKNATLKQLYDLVESGGHPRVKFQSVKFQFNRSKLFFNIPKAISVTANCGEVKFNTTGGESLETVSTKSWTRQKAASVPDMPARLRLIHGHLWQCHASGITVYDTTELKQLRTIASNGLGVVYDVAPLSGREVIVAGSKGLYKMTVTGHMREKLADSYFTGVAYYEARIYALNSSKCTVNVFQNLYRWTEHFSFSLNATKGDIMTLGMCNDLCYVCLPMENKIDVFSLRGELRFSISLSYAKALMQWAFGPSLALKRAFICSTDNEGTMLISDFDNQCLQVQNERRQWNPVRLEPQIEAVCGALIKDGTLYVSSFHGQALYVYES